MAPYPTKTEIEKFSASLATDDKAPFFDHVSPDVVWDVMGTHPAAGHFTSLKSWQDGALRVVNALLSEPLKLKVVNVIGGGEQEWAVVELESINAKCKNGMPYNQKYAWFLKFDKNGIVTEAKAYLDSALIQQCYDANK